MSYCILSYDFNKLTMLYIHVHISISMTNKSGLTFFLSIKYLSVCLSFENTAPGPCTVCRLGAVPVAVPVGLATGTAVGEWHYLAWVTDTGQAQPQPAQPVEIGMVEDTLLLRQLI